MGAHIKEETLGKMRTRENEAEAAGKWVSEISKAAWVAIVRKTAWNSVTLSAIFQNKPLKPSPNLIKEPKDEMLRHG